MSDTTIIALGRYGDIVNILPLAWERSRHGKVRWIVSEQFADILEGAPYVEAIPFKGEYHESVQAAINYAKLQKLPNITVAQPCNPPDKKRLCDSYQKEAWRLSGALDEFGTLPTKLEWKPFPSKRNKSSGRPLVLISTGGVSSPYENAFRLIAMIRGLDCEVVDADNVRCDSVLQIPALFNEANLIVATDSLPLHLSRLTKTLVVSIINNGWKGSIPPPQSIATFRYFDPVESIVSFVEKFVRKITSPIGKLVHCSDIHGHTDRHLIARKSWGDGVFRSEWKRNSTQIGDKRSLPFLKSILEEALHHANPQDCILWTNDDVTIKHPNQFLLHTSVFDFCSIRRDPNHVGREAFAFNAGWLRKNLDSMPDVIIGVPWFDLVIARWMRELKGVKTTKENMAWDFFPAEIEPGAIYHEDHESSWLEHQESPAALHNKKLWLN